MCSVLSLRASSSSSTACLVRDGNGWNIPGRMVVKKGSKFPRTMGTVSKKDPGLHDKSWCPYPQHC